MAKNDTILLDGILAQRVQDSLPSADKGEVFEYFAFEQLLKDYDLSRDEIDHGWVDGRNDGGIDGLYLFINGSLLTDPLTFAWPRSGAVIELYVITAKHHDTYEMRPIDSLCATAQEFFDLAIDRKDVQASYANKVLHIRALFAHAYQRLAAARPVLSINFVYISRGDSQNVAENIINRTNQLLGIVRDSFSCATSTFEFIGASELIAIYRKEKAFSITLPVSESLTSAESGYVVLTKIDDYATFVTDDSGKLRRYLFDSNVRDFLGYTQINLDILETLKDTTAAEFWWLNNGVTILTTSARMIGKTLHLENIQIVNGLQTTETIFEYCNSTDHTSSNRCVLVKAIVSTQASHRDQIIMATNNQNVVDTAGLRATDKVQRDIEEYLERYSWYYERRKNYYKNVGKPPARFVTPLYLAAAFTAIILKRPHEAARMKSRFMRKEPSYRRIFPEDVPIHCWLVLTETFKKAEHMLQALENKKQRGNHFVAKRRGLVAFLAIAKVLGRFSYNAQAVAGLDEALLTDDLFSSIWQLVDRETKYAPPRKTERRANFTIACAEAAAIEFDIEHIQSIESAEG